MNLNLINSTLEKLEQMLEYIHTQPDLVAWAEGPERLADDEFSSHLRILGAHLGLVPTQFLTPNELDMAMLYRGPMQSLAQLFGTLTIRQNMAKVVARLLDYDKNQVENYLRKRHASTRLLARTVDAS